MSTDSRGRSAKNVDQEEIDLSPCAVEEVGTLSWTNKEALSWPGRPARQLPPAPRHTGELRGAPRSRRRFLPPLRGHGTATGSVLQELPASGSLYWYLVVGMGSSVVGPAGEASAGPRVLDASGVCP
jgi:hypothetical protein